MSMPCYQSKFAFLALAVGVLLVGGPTIASTEARAEPAVAQPSKPVGQAASRYYRRNSFEAKPSAEVKNTIANPCGQGWSLGKDGNCYMR
jgi:hypothetical protein